MFSAKQILICGYWLSTAVLGVAAILTAVFYAPVEATMGPVQKIFYLHLPAAISTMMACTVCFAASLAYLMQRNEAWDDLAAAAARVGVQLCTVVLLTGMIWGRSAWGQWWTWSPRLTFVLVLWLLYIVYLMTRASIDSADRRALISAVYAIIAYLDVPLVYLSVKLMPDIHPMHIQLAPAMKLTLGIWFAAVFPLTVGLIAMRYRINRHSHPVDDPVIAPDRLCVRLAGGLQ